MKAEATARLKSTQTEAQAFAQEELLEEEKQADLAQHIDTRVLGILNSFSINADFPSNFFNFSNSIVTNLVKYIFRNISFPFLFIIIKYFTFKKSIFNFEKKQAEI